MLNNVAVQWAIRRVLDYGGWIGTLGGGLLLFYSQLSPSQQNLVGGLLQGNWQDITLGSLFPFIVLVYSQVISFRATVKPQAVVEENGKLVTNTLAPAKEREVAKTVVNVSSKKNLLDILLGK